MLRNTNTDKWRDTFFYNLTPAPKLVFIYLYENCDDAGFMDLNFEQMEDLMKLGKNKLQQCMKVLESRYVKNESGTKIWLKNFLLHQEKLPLNIKVDESKRLVNMLERNSNDFLNDESIQAIVDTAFSKKRRVSTPRAKKAFVKPSLEDVVKHFSADATAHVPESYWEGIWLHYESCGWTVGKKPMVNWVSAFKGCLLREEKKRGSSFKKKEEAAPTRLDKIKEASETPIDFETLKNGR